jgi:mannose-1-phosphate guanylyltransferase
VRHAVILAGGSGTRLWPASRQARPKQLLPLGPDGEALLHAAARRIQLEVGPRIVVVTADAQLDGSRLVLGDLAAELIGEPAQRNTAAALGLAAGLLAARDPDAVFAALPADQHVADEPGLARAFAAAYAAVERDDVICTLGIVPTRPDTGFGYLEVADAQARAALTVQPVRRFVEKPDRATAEGYVAGGHHLWNAGIFFASARRMMAELHRYLPATAVIIDEIVAAHVAEGPAAGQAVARRRYPELASISIDHAVMERTDRVVTIAVDVGWDDVGSWAALPAVRGLDASGNTTIGVAIVVDGTGNVVVSDDDTVIATVGVSDLVVVKSGGAILVLRREHAQDVRKVVEALSARGLARYL